MSVAGITEERLRKDQLMNKISHGWYKHSPEGAISVPMDADITPHSQQNNVDMENSKRIIWHDKPVEFPIHKRYWRRNCNLNRINARTIYEFLRTGRLCGRRVSNFRWALTGR